MGDKYRTIDFLKSNYFENSCVDSPSKNTISLDLGCGKEPRNPFKADKVIGIDINENRANSIIGCNLFINNPPFANNSFDFITAHDFIEHIPRLIILEGKTRFRFVELMNEIYRLLKDGGFFYSHTPAFPKAAAFQDPTHLNIITKETFPIYFCSYRKDGSPTADMYGFQKPFNFIAQQMSNSWLLTLLQKPSR